MALVFVVLASVLLLLSWTGLRAEPFVHRAVYAAFDGAADDAPSRQQQSERGGVTLFATFDVPDLSAALDSDALAKRLAGFHGPQWQMTADEYHQKRGRYVYDTLSRQHERTRDMLSLHDVPFDTAMRLPISNSFLLPKANRTILEQLLAVPGLREIVTASGQRIDLPQPLGADLLSRSKSHFNSQGDVVDEHEKDADPDDPKAMQWNLKKIGLEDVWQQLGDVGKGRSIVYGVADTGTTFKHANLRDNYVGLRRKDALTGSPIYDHNYAWYDGVRTPIGPLGTVGRESKSKCPVAGREPCDDQGHGTHVASIAVGAAGYGVAPQARWMACRNMDAGVGAPQAYLACLNFFLAPHDLDGNNARPDLRPHAVGNSYGCPDSEGCSPRALKSAVEALRTAGVFLAVSAGNEGPECGTVSAPPAVEPAIVAVAATNQRDELARFSSRGPVRIADSDGDVEGGEMWAKPDVSAPGVGIKAAFPPNDYRTLSGTSMAAPHVGGAVVILMSACPCVERDVDMLQSILQATAVHLTPPMNLNGPLCGNDLSDSVPNNYFGYGRIDVLEAVRTCRRHCLQLKASAS